MCISRAQQCALHGLLILFLTLLNALQHVCECVCVWIAYPCYYIFTFLFFTVYNFFSLAFFLVSLCVCYYFLLGRKSNASTPLSSHACQKTFAHSFCALYSYTLHSHFMCLLPLHLCTTAMAIASQL